MSIFFSMFGIFAIIVFPPDFVQETETGKSELSHGLISPVEFLPNLCIEFSGNLEALFRFEHPRLIRIKRT